MDLVITGLALSTDQWFSLKEFEEDLFKEREKEPLERVDSSAVLAQGIIGSG